MIGRRISLAAVIAASILSFLVHGLLNQAYGREVAKESYGFWTAYLYNSAQHGSYCGIRTSLGNRMTGNTAMQLHLAVGRGKLDVFLIGTPRMVSVTRNRTLVIMVGGKAYPVQMTPLGQDDGTATLGTIATSQRDAVNFMVAFMKASQAHLIYPDGDIIPLSLSGTNLATRAFLRCLDGLPSASAPAPSRPADERAINPNDPGVWN